MENVTHWTQGSIENFVYNIASDFVGQLETKMEEGGVSRHELAIRLKRTDGRVSQVLNNPGNLSIRVSIENARALGMKVSLIAYDDGDPNNNHGPINPEVFVKCWEHAGRPVDLFEVEDAFSYRNLEEYIYTLPDVVFSREETMHVHGFDGFSKIADELPSKAIFAVGTPGILGYFESSASQPPNAPEEIPVCPSLVGLISQQQTLALQET